MKDSSIQSMRKVLALVCVFTTNNFDRGHQNYLEIERETPVVNIPEVEFDPLLDVRNALLCATTAMDLRPTGDARFGMVPIRIISN